MASAGASSRWTGRGSSAPPRPRPGRRGGAGAWSAGRRDRRGTGRGDRVGGRRRRSPSSWSVVAGGRAERRARRRCGPRRRCRRARAVRGPRRWRGAGRRPAAGVRPALRSRARAPDTCGAAIEVPARQAYSLRVAARSSRWRATPWGCRRWRSLARLSPPRRRGPRPATGRRGDPGAGVRVGGPRVVARGGGDDHGRLVAEASRQDRVVAGRDHRDGALAPGVVDGVAEARSRGRSARRRRRARG